MRMLILYVALFVLACAGGGPSYTPEDCRQDVELAELLAKRITQLVDDGAKVSPADWDRYAAIVQLLARGGCEYVPEEWARDAPE